MSNAITFAVIRWIDADNADSLGYDEVEYAEGRWVIEDSEGAWSGDLHSIGETAVDTAQAMAEQTLNPRSDRTWRALPSNYGTAYELVSA